MDEKLFQKNLELWMRSYPKEAVLIPYADSSHVQDCLTVKGEPNLKVDGYFLESNEGAAEAAKAWFSSLDLSQVSQLIVYGVGLGYYYEAAVNWLKKDKRRGLFFLEDSLGVIHKLLQTELGAKILQNPQVHLIYYSDLNVEGPFETLYWNTSMAKIHVTALESYKNNRQKEFLELSHKIAYDASMNNALVDEFVRYGVGFHHNLYQNILMLEGAYLGNDLFGRFSKVPAIICGAGPSLEKSLPLLKSLNDKAIIFAGGSALNVLTHHGLHPHFGAGIDPNATQSKRLSESNTEELPFFYRNRMHHSAFKQIKGPRLYITGAGGFNTPQYFEDKLEIERECIDEGHNVINFIVELASAMGCDPIIFVGMDLAFTGMKGYAEGVVEDSTVAKDQITKAASDDDRAVLKEDIFGKPTYTLWKWVAESKWIGKFSEEHADIRMVNCTGGGIGFPGVANKSLEDISHQFLKRQYELRDRIHGEIQNVSMPQVTTQKIIKLMNELVESLRNTTRHFDVLLKDVQNEMEKIGQGQEPGQSGLAALAETELVEEPAYDYVLDPFSDVIGRLMGRESHAIGLRRYSKKTRAIKKLELKREKMEFLRNVALANAELILNALKEHKSESLAVKFESLPAGLVAPKGTLYEFKNDHLVLEDPQMGLHVNEVFSPVLLPKERLAGATIGDGCILKKVYAKSLELSECFIEKEGVIEGEWQLFYPEGALKQTGYYKAGKLHGPVTFYSEKGGILAQSWYLNGKREGRTFWYDLNGKLYSIQSYKEGEWDGLQYYLEGDSKIKALLNFKNGKRQVRN